MTSRLVSRLVLVAAVFSHLPAPARAQSVAAAPARPTLAERIDRLATEFDRNRIDLHVPVYGIQLESAGRPPG